MTPVYEMAIRNIHASKGAVFTGLLIVSLLFQFLPQHWTNPLNFMFVRFFGPFLHVGRQFSIETVRMSGSGESVVPKAQYDKLWKNHKNLTARFDILEKDYQTVSKVRRSLPGQVGGIIPARCAASKPARHELIIDKGRDDGIVQGQVVLSAQAEGVIGSVKEVSDRMSRVQLITDPTCSLEVWIKREGTKFEFKAHLVGDGRSACTMNLIPRDTAIRCGDTVYAAASPGLLEVPVVIGEVSEIVPDLKSPTLCRISVSPVEDLSRLNEVVVIVPPGVKIIGP